MITCPSRRAPMTLPKSSSPYDILDLPLSASETDVKKQYRKKSLLIHPDKFKHEKGLEAFDFLKKAHDHLADPAKRKDIDMIMTHARTQVLKSILGDGYSTTVSDDDPRLTNLSPPFEQQVRAKGREILVEDELARRRKQKLAYANEGAEKARAEAEVAARKRKVEEQAKWEERRDDRIKDWRDFSQKKEKKRKKNNLHVLG
ncbi:chaperone regulator [Cryptococcus bacillisporus CA1873]|uniref:Chaperone regulator n=2 Tax=Cryptococcus gattii TaxID=552467 RepID=A0A0D0VMZ0_CRYGA|nr:chaperone regulator [Cryptococcus bacillisporus CA1280]KIR67486.1 chaperone regulator [Cryptococcus bacillisporus CA1873]KIR87494.1 chaperone regulator [Cryptococcus tetragattii IND107]|eukprot:KIR67486.1 chaperone regulator [Cryptococcus gattii CA1873]